LLHPTACPLVRGSDDALVHVDDLSLGLEQPYIFGRGKLALQKVFVVIVVLPDDTYPAVAHAELSLEVPRQQGGRELDAMLGL